MSVRLRRVWIVGVPVAVIFVRKCVNALLVGRDEKRLHHEVAVEFDVFKLDVGNITLGKPRVWFLRLGFFLAGLKQLTRNVKRDTARRLDFFITRVCFSDYSLRFSNSERRAALVMR